VAVLPLVVGEFEVASSSFAPNLRSLSSFFSLFEGFWSKPRDPADKTPRALSTLYIFHHFRGHVREGFGPNAKLEVLVPYGLDCHELPQPLALTLTIPTQQTHTHPHREEDDNDGKQRRVAAAAAALGKPVPVCLPTTEPGHDGSPASEACCNTFRSTSATTTSNLASIVFSSAAAAAGATF
jgi:hypothetical protein